ncbi:hypothetical protein [Erythrobacter sp. HKB08]|uniref:hypothetical protein n=1 Tax=Erythrobacter sp. HKB08 TaxID=2502843 RepID=UPI00100893C4|nr:hypothetical protein [Erythrobacter sp. HKB08]
MIRLGTLLRTIELLALAAVFVAGWLALGRDLVDLVTSERIEGQSDVTPDSRYLVYALQEERPTPFVFSRPTQLFRISSLPVIEREAWEATDSWSYGYRLVMRDSSGTIVETRDIFSRSLRPDRILPYKRPIRFFRGDDALISLSDDLVVESATPIASVEMTPVEADAGVEQIAVRVYQRLPYSDAAARAEFQRRSPEERAIYGRASALPADILSDTEKGNIIRNRWRIVGPAGVAGSDYTVRIVYEGRLPEAQEAQR